MWGAWLTTCFGAFAWLLLAWSLLAIGRTPVRWLWKPAIAATEWGHWLGWIALLAGALGMLLGGSLWGVLPALAAAVLFHTPLLRASIAARGVERRLVAALGDDTGGAPGLRRRAPLTLASLLHITLPRIEPVRHVYRDVDGLALTLDLYPAAGAASRPTLVLVVHGGSWNSGSSGQLTGMNRYLAGSGYTVAALNYRLAPRFRFPAAVEDIGAAVRYLEETMPPEGRGRVVLLGRSSGGHLALLAAYRAVHPSIRGVVALYPPTDLVWSWERPAPGRLMDSNGVIRQFLGGSPEDMPDRFRAASPIRLVRPGLPPTLLIHGGNDEMVSPLQSRRLARELARAGARHVHLELPWAKHGMDANLAGPSGQIVLYAVERLLAAVGEESDQPKESTAGFPARVFPEP